MRITRKTLTREILPLLTPERVERILEAVNPYPLEKPVLAMTIGEFIACSEESYVNELLSEPLAYKAFGRVKQLRYELTMVGDYLRRYEVPPTAEEKAAAAGIDFPTAGERMVLDCIRWGLVNPKEGEDMVDAAERVRLTTWLIGAKDKAASAQFERRMQARLTKKKRT